MIQANILNTCKYSEQTLMNSQLKGYLSGSLCTLNPKISDLPVNKV